MPDYAHPKHNQPSNHPIGTADIEAMPTDTLRNLSLACPHHSRPLVMQPVGETASACGELLVLYACADVGCRYREGWRMDFATGRPYRALHGFDQSQR